ncbi:hypothetical protein DWW36_05380 [Erysipelotrichaceae bacterium AF15-26LB]|nr:bifunctional DNA primase/polymerase domain protein [Erysipelotrichaceae bacterium 3_1_53]RJV90781.1 hypothetical protein DWW36_05380 [Erysipelotrichaceae bacterium AF15-26LB]RJV93371.1 hypothetical protein DWX45_00675 [Erysipelotrichaceae bacterium AF19-24AC]
MESLLNYALTYAQVNCKVFPLKVNSKDGQTLTSLKEKATTDKKQITKWFTNTDYNVCVSTGEGIIVIEVDAQKNGKEIIERYIKQFPITMTVRTPDGGWHFYYQVNKEIDTQFNLYKGINVYGNGSFVLGAGSQLENGNYYISINKPIAKANEFIHEFLKGAINDFQVTWKSALEMSQLPQQENTDIIKQLLPVGVTLFGAPSKMGKTFLCMQLANAVAEGTEFLGYTCQKKNVYYIALEDPENNQIERLKKASFDIACGYDIEITPAYQVGFDLEQKIINYLHFNPNLGVVIIDTFEKIRMNNDRTYTIEYKEVTYYHELGLKYDIAIILVMHTIKNINYSNTFANISGSAGTLAAADGLMMLLRNQIDQDIKMLYIDGKGIPADIIHMKQDKNMTYCKIDKDNDNANIDSDLMDIIHYVIENSKYIGSCEKLAVGSGITNCNGKHIRSLLDKNKNILEMYFIRYSVPPRTSYSRKIELVFYGEDRFDNDVNDEMTIK